jgi:D-glycero-alpha-D-manno-heptose-7-phosphate kinase
MIHIRARAPLRLGFAGGGTDLSPYCDIHGGAILNATIDQYAYATLQGLDDDLVIFEAKDTGALVELRSDPGAMETQGALVLHRAVYKRVCQEFRGGVPFPCRLTTYCEAPPGSGLGSSSTMVVAMLKAFTEALQLPLGDYDMAHLAYKIEREDALLQGGRQDQYAATFGGFNFMEFSADNRVIVNPLRIKNWVLSELESSLVLFFSGQSRSSADIIAEQTKNISGGKKDAGVQDSKPMEAMHQLRADAYEMKNAVLRGDIKNFAAILNKSWTAKKSTAANISNAKIDGLMDLAFAHGALAGKVSGAGGGGFLTFIVDPVHRLNLIRKLGEEDGQVLPCSFTKRGTEGWRID